MSRAQKRKIILIVLLVLLLAGLGAYYAYYRSTQKLTLDIAPVASDSVSPPEFLFSFNGGQARRMQRPVGVLADGEDVYVVDSLWHRIDVFNRDGAFKRSFGTSETVIPLNIAKHPVNGNLYVTDRRSRSVHIFTPQGRYVGDFDPKLPKAQLPKFDTKGVQWAPVAICFAPDATMYVTEILNGHRLLVFNPNGKFTKSIGTVGIVTDANAAPGVFQFPNGVAFNKGLVYVTDSNNRRIQVFDKAGVYKKVIVTQGLPRGISFLGRFPADEPTTPDRFVVVDTLAHDGTLWNTKGTKLVSFGQQGVLEGQFSYPNGVSIGTRNRIYIADTANGRVQVWGWPEQVSPVPIPRIPQNWVWCLTPLLLLPLLFLLRRKRFFATADFIFELAEAGELDLMPQRRRKWFVTAEDFERVKDIKQGEVELSELLHVSEYSESDVRAMMDKLEIAEQPAIVLSIATRSKLFCTQDEELRRLARVLEVDVVNRIEFLDRFTKRRAETTPLDE